MKKASAAPAVGGRDVGAQQTEFAAFVPEGSVDVVLLLPLFPIGRDFTIEEFLCHLEQIYRFTSDPWPNYIAGHNFSPSLEGGREHLAGLEFTEHIREGVIRPHEAFDIRLPAGGVR